MTRTRTVAATALAALAVAGCGGSDDSGSGDAKPPATAGSKVSIVDFKFKPAKLTVPVGAKLVFANDDTAAHTATSKDRSFDTGSIRKGKQAGVTISKAGTFAYICDFHPFMKGTVTAE